MHLRRPIASVPGFHRACFFSVAGIHLLVRPVKRCILPSAPDRTRPSNPSTVHSRPRWHRSRRSQTAKSHQRRRNRSTHVSLPSASLSLFSVRLRLRFAESCGVLDHHGIARARALGTRPALRQPAQCALSCGRCVPCYRCHEGPTRGLSPRMGPSSRLRHPGRPWPLLRFARSWVPRETPASDLSSRYLRGRPVRVQSHLRPRVTVPVPSCALGRWLRSSAYASNKITEAEHGHHWMTTTVCCTFCSGSHATQQGGVAHSGRV